MKNEQPRKINPDAIANLERAVTVQSWPVELDWRDSLSPARRPLEPRLNDGDLLHGEGP